MARASKERRTSDTESARFLLRLPAMLHAGLLDRARARGLSLNEYLVRRLAGAEPHAASAGLASLLLSRAHAVAGTRVVGIVLHGSWTRGEARAASDIDALIVVDVSLPLTRALYRTWDDEPIVWQGRAVDVHFVHLPSSLERAGGMWCEAAIEGRVISDTSGRVEDTLVRLRHAIADGRLVRKHAHGQPYWTAAPDLKASAG